MSEESNNITGNLKGRSWVFGDNINTDIIIPFRFKSRTNDPYEMAKYAMYGLDPDFHKKISPGDIIVAGQTLEGDQVETGTSSIKICRHSSSYSRTFAGIL